MVFLSFIVTKEKGSGSLRILSIAFTEYWLNCKDRVLLSSILMVTYLASPLCVTPKTDDLFIWSSADKLTAQRLAAVSTCVTLLMVALTLEGEGISLIIFKIVLSQIV